MFVVRLLIPVAELDLFNSLVSPFEHEAYDILKCRSSEYQQESNGSWVRGGAMLTMLM